MANNETLLQEIRDSYTLFERFWNPIFYEGDIDMRFRAGDPWPPRERAAREGKRMCMGFDQCGQYVNQVVNEVRVNPRTIKFIPAGPETTDDEAQWRTEVVRGIQYRSNAQQAYIWGFQGAVERSYGFWEVGSKYISDSNFEQELVIRRILNPSSVLLDPFAQEVDWSDMKRAFVIDFMREADYKREFPDADVQGFTQGYADIAPSWIRRDGIQVAAFWKVEEKREKLYLLQGGDGGIVTTTKPEGAKALFTRELVTKKIRRYTTNGVEILREEEWPGEYIPIIPCMGRELWISDRGSTKRQFMSLIRLARDPQTLYAYMRTNEAEEAKLTPKSAFVGYEGQFEGHEKEWETMMDDPKAYVEVKAKTEATGDQILPLPTRPQFIPNFQAYSIAAEDSRRDIQAAMGVSALPTAAQRQSEKSGVALKRIELQMAKGSYDFLDNFDVALRHTGRVLNPLLKLYYGDRSSLPAAGSDRTFFVLQMRNQGFKHPITKRPAYVDLAKGDYDVTVATGPAYDSQREEANEFVDALVSNLKALPVPPAIAVKLLAMSIRMKALGPIGDKMADLLDPQQDQEAQIPPQAMQMIQQKQQEAQALYAYVKQLKAELEEIKRKLDSKQMEIESKEAIAKLQAQVDILTEEIKIRGQAMLEALKADLQDGQQDESAGEPEFGEAVERGMKL